MLLKEQMLDLCGREMTEQELKEVEKYRLDLNAEEDLVSIGELQAV